MINGTRTALGPDYGTVTKQTSIGYSRYNGLELNLHYTKGPASILAGYTYSKSVDVSSNLGEQVNPFNVALSEAPSAFDLRHNFVVSYSYELPFARLFNSSNQLTNGWSLSGTTRLSSGFPGHALQPDGHVAARHVRQRRQQQPARHAELHAGLRSEDQPRSGEGAGVQHGVLQPAAARPARQRAAPVLLRSRHRELRPGADQERAVREDAEPSKSASRRSTSSTIPQFYGAGAVDGNIVSPTFGEIEAAAAPRFIQLAAKFSF